MCDINRWGMVMAGFYALIARYYDSEHQDKTDDLQFYADLVADYGGPVLIVGAGTGRVLLHLARQGHTVHGIETEEAMLERLRAKREATPDLRDRTTVYETNVLAARIDQTFKTVIIPYNTLMHIHEQPHQLDLLRRIRGWLADDGMLAFDLPNAGEAFAGLDLDSITFERSFLDIETGHLVMQQSISQLDRTEQLMYVTWLYDEVTADGTMRRTVAPVVNRYYFFSEIKLLLAATGFEEVQVYGDFDYSDYVDGSPRMIVVAK